LAVAGILDFDPVARQPLQVLNDGGGSESKLVSVDVRTQSGFTFGKPAPIRFRARGSAATAATTTSHLTANISSVIVPASTASARPRCPTQQIKVVLNWFSELTQRVPVK
jgi:hypothetical protein